MENDPAGEVLRVVFDRDAGPIKAGTRDCGIVFDTTPPVVISPHWAYGWFGQHNNREKVREAIRSVLNEL